MTMACPCAFLARLAILLSLVMLTGCASAVRVNYGAENAVYMASPQFMFEAMPPGVLKSNHILRGFYHPETRSIYISEGMSPRQTMLTFVHELAHAFDHQKPVDMWSLLRAYQSPRFDFNFHKEQE